MVNVLRFVKNVGKTLISVPTQAIKSIPQDLKKGVKLWGQALNPPQRKDTVYMTAPIGLSSGVGVASGLKSAGKGISNFVKRQTVNPFAGVTVKEGTKTLGKTFLGGATRGLLAGTSYGVTRSGLTGENMLSPKNIMRSGVVGLGFGISPVAGVSATAVTGAEYLYKGGKKIIGTGGEKSKELLDLMKGQTNKAYDYIGSGDYANYMEQLYRGKSNYPDKIKDVFGDFRYPDTNLTLVNPVSSFPSPITNIGMPSFSPAVQVGGGDSITPLLLALLGGGALGLAIGKRRKKKKKYKKKRRRK